ncbi:MAG: type I polyketide synthase, partial [Acidobacteriota bacterium]
IEVRVAAAGLNFRDVLNALGMYAGEAGPMGQECVGTVVGVGAGVAHLRLGDEVMGMASRTFSTYVTGSAAGFVVKPANLDIEDAATIPVAFLTAEFGLNRLARMAAGDRVLIHAAAGGVGLAAVQLAQRAGAEIFATAGSSEKHAYLKSLGVRHVMSSRSLDFAEQIRQLTGGTGVDIVLNSLAADFIEKSLSVVKHGGRFVEIGRAGIWTAAEMAAVRPDVEYFPMLTHDDIAAIQPVLAALAGAFSTGELKPLRRVSYSIHSAVDAFRYMAQAKHIGKIVLTLESPAASRDRPPLTSEATYLITGGLGALGLHVAQWMVEAGARHLVLSGRSLPDAQAGEAVARLEAAGAEVRLDRADVSSAADVRRLIDEISQGMPPLRGIVHAAGALDDGTLRHQTWPRFDRMLGAKARGAWNLHEHTRTAPLDFFVMFSSMVSVLGGPGQGIYAAASAFLDGLAHHRRRLGLPALTIDWGAWSGNGMAGRVTDRDRARWTELGYGLIAPEEGVTILGRLLAQAPPRPQVAVLPIDWAALLGQFPQGGEPPLLTEFVQTQAARAVPSVPVGRTLLQDLEAIAPSGRRAAVLGFVRGSALRVLGLEAATEIDPRQPLRDFGLDSLMAVELRNVLAGAVGRTLPATLLFKHPTIDALAGFVIEAAGLSAAAVETVAVPDGDVAAIGALDDDDVRKLLAEELAALSSTDWSGSDRSGSG